MQAPAGPSTDFDFEIGQWRVAHRRLRERLAGCSDWEEFGGSADMRPILGGNGNVEDNLIHLPSGSIRAIALRSFDPATGSWAIWWLSSTAPHVLDVPVKGRFEHGEGSFFADDVLRGRPIRVRFLWLRTRTATPRWSRRSPPTAAPLGRPTGRWTSSAPEAAPAAPDSAAPACGRRPDAPPHRPFIASSFPAFCTTWLGEPTIRGSGPVTTASSLLG